MTRKYKYRNAIRKQKSKLTVFLLTSTAAYIGSSSSPWKNTQCSICVTSNNSCVTHVTLINLHFVDLY